MSLAAAGVRRRRRQALATVLEESVAPATPPNRAAGAACPTADHGRGRSARGCRHCCRCASEALLLRTDILTAWSAVCADTVAQARLHVRLCVWEAPATAMEQQAMQRPAVQTAASLIGRWTSNPTVPLT